MKLPILSALAGGVLLPAMVFAQYPIPAAPSYPANTPGVPRSTMPSPLAASPAFAPAPWGVGGAGPSNATPAWNGGARLADQNPMPNPGVRLGSPAMPQTGGYVPQSLPQPQTVYAAPPTVQTMPQQPQYGSIPQAMPQQGYNLNPGAPVQGYPVAQNYPVQGFPVQGNPVRGTTMQGVPNPGTSYQTMPAIQNGAPVQGYNAPNGEYVPSAPMQPYTPATSSPAFVGEVLNQTGPEGCPSPVGTCGPNGPCGPAGRFWIAPEYVYWIAKGSSVPALVTSAPTGLPRNTAGTLGNPATSTLFGGGNLNNDFRSGFRVRSGFWLDCCQTIGLDASAFYLGQGTDGGQFSSMGNPGLFRPFRNALTGMQATQLVAFLDPNGANGGLTPIVSGGANVRATSDVWGGDINLRKNLCCTPCSRLDLLLGYRYMRLRDTLDIREDLVSSGMGNPFAPMGTTIVVRDRFSSVNEFNGGQIGLAGEVRRGAFFMGYTAKVAIGNTHSTVDINGSRTATLPNGGGSSTSAGGLLAQPSNIGRYSYDEFSVLPEGGLTLGYQVTSHIRAYAGYNFLYWNKVLRASEQVDTNINPTQIPGGRDPVSNLQVPAFRPTYSEYWIQGVTFGLELRF